MRYIKIQHSVTGEEAIIDTYMSRYRRLGMGFLNSLKLTPRFVKHITLTQKVESYKPNILNPFFVKLRRYYGDVVYIWTAEVQEGRAEKHGERVLHWHVLMGFDYGIDFGKEDIARLQLYWKYGNLDVKPLRRANLSYLMKYMSKALGIGIDASVRRIGSSQIAGYLRQSWGKVSGAIQFFLDFGQFLDVFSMFKWSHRGASANFEGQKVWFYRYPSSLWSRLYSFDDVSLLDSSEPF